MRFEIRLVLVNRKSRAVDDVSFSIFAGETLGLVGESFGVREDPQRRRLHHVERWTNRPTGEILFNSSDSGTVDIATLSHREMFPLRRDIQMIFQDPYASLNSRMNIFDIIGEPLLVIGGMKKP